MPEPGAATPSAFVGQAPKKPFGTVCHAVPVALPWHGPAAYAVGRHLRCEPAAV